MLERTPVALRAQLHGLSTEWTTPNEGDGTWSVRDIVAHLIHGEHTDWIPRARIILAGDENATFAPFDREGGFDEARRKPLEELLKTFQTLRTENLRTIDGFRLTERHLAMAARHPRFGRVTLPQLLATWAVHDLNHIAQINRVMSRQYQGEVGPWREFLGILK